MGKEANSLLHLKLSAGASTGRKKSSCGCSAVNQLMLSPASWVSKPTAWRSGIKKLSRGLKLLSKNEAAIPLVAAELDSALRRIGELTMENELLRYKVRKALPLAPERSKK